MEYGDLPGSKRGSGSGNKHTKKQSKSRGTVCETPRGRMEDQGPEGMKVGQPRGLASSDESYDPGYSHKGSRGGASKGDTMRGYQ